MDLIKIGKFITEERKRKNYTQKQLADILVVSDRTISKWECGKGFPEVALLLPLCNELGITVNELLAGERLTGEDYMKKAEENMVEYLREKEDNKTKLFLIGLVGTISIVSFLTLLLFTIAYTNKIATQDKIILVLIATAMLAVGIITLVIGSWKCGYYKCTCCNKSFVPTFLNYTTGTQLVGKNLMKCPCCGKKNWCEKVLAKENYEKSEKINANIQDENQIQIKTHKLSWLFAGVTLLCIIGYIVKSCVKGFFSIETLVCMLVIFVPIQIFYHVYLSCAVKRDSYGGIAGFNDKIEYNFNEVKKLLVRMDIHIQILSCLSVALLYVINTDLLNYRWLNGIALIVYVLIFIIVIIINNYFSSSKMFVNECDRKRFVKSIPVTMTYISSLFIGIGLVIGLFEIKGIENNTPPAVRLAVLLILGVVFSTIGYMVEVNNIKKCNFDKDSYRINVMTIVSFILCFVLYGLMFVL